MFLLLIGWDCSKANCLVSWEEGLSRGDVENVYQMTMKSSDDKIREKA